MNAEHEPKAWIQRLPNQLTYLRIILTPVFIWLLFTEGVWNKLLALVVFIVASVSDAYDGKIARQYNVVSEEGKFMDPLADKILVLGSLLAIWYLDFYPLWMWILILLRDVSITGLRKWMIANNSTMETSYFAKTKTAAQMTAIYLFIIYLLLQDWALMDSIRPALDWMSASGALWWLMFLVTLVTVISGIHYFILNWSFIKKYIRVHS
ncbi:MAG: CDP-diacylglycerol--glycerol-3-phosphate 3-phosphatidyltransferase [Candidatus Marinimicrobia bacterium]|nr:CDP-diacylglycerol--glycerol-3-phosphate 3-phosphatidyltransferase [Candidatus Neomarinimicrobiota bacterium]